jgi:predicted nicotinamide N-methyase
MVLSSSWAQPIPYDARAARTLREQLAARYDLVREAIAVAGRRFAITVVRDTNALLESIHAEEFARDERLPYWAELWTSSLELARWSLKGGVGRGMRVLELGCGLGLVGIAAARAGGHVTMTDYEPDALAFARLNAADNLPQPSHGDGIRVAMLDWRDLYRGEQYGLVLGSDIVYDRSVFEPLLRCLQECLAPGGRAVMTDPDRAVGRAFLELAAQSGFDVTTVAVPTVRRGRTVTVLRATLQRSPRP